MSTYASKSLELENKLLIVSSAAIPEFNKQTLNKVVRQLLSINEQLLWKAKNMEVYSL